MVYQSTTYISSPHEIVLELEEKVNRKTVHINDAMPRRIETQLLHSELKK